MTISYFAYDNYNLLIVISFFLPFITFSYNNVIAKLIKQGNILFSNSLGHDRFTSRDRDDSRANLWRRNKLWISHRRDKGDS